MILVFGATGNVGGALVRQLHEQGHQVRAFVRDASHADRFPEGVDIAVGDLDDPPSVAAAVDGVAGVFSMQASPGTAQTETFVDAARNAGVRRIVAMTSIGARLQPLPLIGAGLAAREEVLRAADLGVTFLRPNTLMSNALWWVDSIREQGRVVDACGQGRMPCVDPEDIARVAAVTITGQGHENHGYTINGPEALTTKEQVDVLADVLGRPIEFEDVTPEQLAASSIERGTSPEEAHALQDLNEMFRAGRAGVVTDDVQNLTGAPPVTFRSWCERHRASFR